MSNETHNETTTPESTAPDSPVEDAKEPIVLGLQKRQLILTAVAVAIAGLIGVGIGAALSGGDEPQEEKEAEQSHDHGTVYTCSMHPQIRSEEQGQCPICGMDLIPASEDDDASDDSTPNRVRLTERSLALAKIRTAPVERKDSTTRELGLLGRIEPDETRVKSVTAWTAGRIDRLRIATTGQRIAKGQVIATIYSPEIYAAHRDLLQAQGQLDRLGESVEFARSSASATLEASRQKLRLLGVSNAELKRMEASEKPWTAIEIRAHASGVILDRLVDEGNYVDAGTPLYRVADLRKLWLQLDAYEHDLKQISKGQDVTFQVAGIEDTFEGKVAFIDPIVDRAKRVAKVRVEIDNPDGALRPGMFAEATVHSRSAQAEQAPLTVPDTAPLFTGRRSVVYVEVPDMDRPTYDAREVRLGPKSGEVYPVLSGLSEGERVVVYGAFTLDADLQIKGGQSMMTRDDDQTREPAKTIDIDEEFKAQLSPIVDHYLKLTAALADDALDDAHDASNAMASAIGAAVAPESAEAKGTWKRIQARALKHAQDVSTADGIDATRARFEDLSKTIAQIVETFGNPTDRKLRWAHCPMAFDNRGADWIQSDDQLANPYYGESMLRCGEFRQTVDAGMYPAEPKSSPSTAPTTAPTEDR